MLLSKQSYLPDKLLKILMIFVLVFSLTLQKPKEANAFPLALLLPAITNPAAITGLLSVVGIAAVGSSTSDYFNEKIAQLEQTAIDTVGLMGQSMSQDLQKSLQGILDGTKSVYDLSANLLSELITNLSSLNDTVPVIPEGAIVKNGREFTLNGDNKLLIEWNPQNIGVFQIPTFNASFNNNFRLTLSIGSTSIFQNYLTQAEGEAFMATYNNYVASTTATIYDFLTLFNRYSDYTLGLRLGTTDYYPTGNVSLELDNINDYLTDQVLNNETKLGLNLGINDLVNLQTQQGVPLYVDNLGQVVLKDGRPFDGDLSDIVVSHNVPQVIDHAGVLTPTISTDFGAVDVITGGIVIPNPNPPTPNLPPNIKPESTRPPIGIQRFLPAALVIAFVLFLKAIVMYAIRLFDYLLSIPFIPSKPIDNYAFQWFKNADILGIEVYNTVIAFATFCFSFTVYKVIRRIW